MSTSTMHSFGVEIIKGMLDADLKGLWGAGPVPWKEHGSIFLLPGCLDRGVREGR